MKRLNLFPIALAVSAALQLSLPAANAQASGQPAGVAEKTTGSVRTVKSVPDAKFREKPQLPPKPKDRPSSVKKLTDVVPPESVVANKKSPAGPAGPGASPLGLPRLKPVVVGGSAPVAANRYDLDTLEAPAGGKGIKREQRDDTSFLAIDAGSTWSRPVRGAPNDVVFASFAVHASVGTEIRVGGAWLRVGPGTKAGYLDLLSAVTGENGAIEWKPLRYSSRLGIFDGRELAILPVLTVRLDQANGIWDLFSGVRLVAGSRSLITGEKSARKFAVEGGTAGAWVCGIVLSEENPLFADANANGFPDNLETAIKGNLLPATISLIERQAFAEEWRRTDRTTPPVFRLARPQPDRLVALAPAK